MKRDVKTVAGWDFDRIIPCHGVRLRVPAGLVLALTVPVGRDREGWKGRMDGGL